MAISKSHRQGSCILRAWDLALGSLLFVTILASCSAAPSIISVESTTLPTEVEEATTILPVPQDEISSSAAPTKQNDTVVTYLVDPAKIEESDHADSTQLGVTEASEAKFVSVYGATLEQDIKNDVKSEVEDEAESPVDTLIDDIKADAAEVENHQQERDVDVQNFREPKALEAEEENADQPQQEEDSYPDTVTDNIAVSSEVVESRVRPLPNITSDLVSVILNEDKAITEQPITKTNLLALEQEHENFESEYTTPEPTYEEPKHQVTKKQGVEDVPPELAPGVEDEPEGKVHREERQFEQPDLKLNEIDEEEAPQKSSTTAKPLVHVELAKSEDEVQDIEKKTEDEAKAEIEDQVVSQSNLEETVVDPAEGEVTNPAEEDPGTTEESIAEETKVETTTAATHPQHEIIENEPQQPAVEASTQTNPEPEIQTQEPAVEVSTDVHFEPDPVESKEATEESPKAVDESQSVEEKHDESAESEVKPTVEPEADKEDSSSSEEEEKDETKPPSDDSTATPLVSYPPHDAGRTFDSNTADEHSAQLSNPSNYRSTLIIALCSGTAVIFIVASLVIFVVSFQRQHGTLDIEMQEQRLGKDIQDDEDAQMKLLDVDLTKAVIVPSGNEETDECL
ncbi:uncharacterized protein Dana_GF17112, isoform B [Drosophila ananassae]|uniref:Uncharacterized protein, isoform B n=1 Tax=Drosophila ananassae TaxID=7217 RepID=B3M1X2_DROAN|nr:protein P200 isoform X2 [Drosophila ananassae]EDV42232.2 uncharacterized protein Dana_GF17112, isoform B [Drosophila ananassae]